MAKAPLKCCIIFINTKDYLDSLHKYLSDQGYISHVIAGGRVDDAVRDRIIDKIRRGEVKVLLTTNVLARGVDFRMVNIVINLDPPGRSIRNTFEPDPVTYLHRVGRTGRYGRKGIALNIVTD